MVAQATVVHRQTEITSSTNTTHLTFNLPCFRPDRSGIVDVAAVEQLQENLIKALRSLITSRRPDDSTLFPKLLLRLPDLRTLNNHHSDKLLAFRIDP